MPLDACQNTFSFALVFLSTRDL